MIPCPRSLTPTGAARVREISRSLFWVNGAMETVLKGKHCLRAIIHEATIIYQSSRMASPIPFQSQRQQTHRSCLEVCPEKAQ